MIEIVYTLIVTHITMICVCIYLHRGLTHKTMQFKPVLEHFFRFWLWLTDGVMIKDWVATHRKHHRYADKPGDPHSPVLLGIKTIAWTNFYETLVYRYRNFAPQWETEIYGKETPDDWLERNVYVPHQRLGLLLMLLINVLLFGRWGILIWFIQLAWTPFWSGSIITGFAHYIGGYHNKDANDNSRNFPFLGFFIIGDELHSNHHAEPWNAKLSRKWYEFDLGWMYIKIFEKFGLLTVIK
jgi:stearoyl-CoA desaturase (delta-9 desaturase)